MDIVRQFGQLGLQVCTNPYNGRLSAPTDKEQGLIDELRSEFEASPRVAESTGSEAARIWERFQENLRHLVLTEDPREFLSWDVISKTMFLAFSSYAVIELLHLRRKKDWPSRWKDGLRESRVGRPARFLFYPRSSANLIHDAYTLCAFEEATGRALRQFNNVLEFGGGYGSMCRLFFNLGFNGRYVIYDLPPFSNLQSYYLRSLGIPVLPLSSLARSERGVSLASGEDDFLPSAEPFRPLNSLFIASWSLNETSLEVRQRILPYVAEFDAFLIAYQEQFGEMNNREFFERWQEEMSATIEWSAIPIRHIRGGHHYLFGTRRSSKLLGHDRCSSIDRRYF